MRGAVLVVVTILLVCPAVLADSEVEFAQKPTATRVGGTVRIEFAVDRETDVAVTVEDAKGKVVRHLAAGVIGRKRGLTPSGKATGWSGTALGPQNDDSPPSTPRPQRRTHSKFRLGVLGDLGGKTSSGPFSLKANSLQQSIDWDTKDDAGKPAQGGPFTVRVALGLAPRLEAYLFDTPGAIRGTECLAVDGEGNLYHCTNAGGVYAWNAPGMLMRVYDRQGRYLRTIVPFPANTPLDSLKGTGAFQVAGHLYPVWHDIMKMRIYPGRETYGHEMFVTSEGRLYKLVNVSPGYYSKWSLRVINTDGSIPSGVPILGPVFAAAMRTSPAGQRSWICASSDEKWAYASGLATRKNDKDKKLHAVYRAPLDGSSEGRVFLGSPEQSGDDEKHFDQPKGVTTDGKGLLYVSDFGNNRIQIFKEADASFVDSVAVKGPTTVQVHPKTGALYVLTAVKLQMALVKISGRESPKEEARLPIGRAADERFGSLVLAHGETGGTSLGLQSAPKAASPAPVREPLPGVLDASADPPVLWCGGLYGWRHILRIEDKGASFDVKQMGSKGIPSCGNAEDLLVDRTRDELYFKTGTETFMRMDLKTGKVTKLPYPYAGGAEATQLGLSPDGNIIYSFSHYQGLRKFDRNFKPVPFEALGTNRLKINSAMNFAARSMAVAPDGNIYLVPTSQGRATFGINEMEVYRPDGVKKGVALWRLSEGLTGPRFDRQGNIYVIECVRQPGKLVPDFFKDRLPADPERPRNAVCSPRGSAAWMYASVVKFPPTGGIIWYAPGKLPGKAGWGGEVPAAIRQLPQTAVSHTWGHSIARTVNTKMQGALWYHYGAAPFADKCGGYDCNCQSARFDVDDFGRVFFPDCGRFRVGVLDTNGNFITAFGHYGNRDSAGPGSRIPKPEIAFAYPFTVAVSRTHVLVGDLLNGRIVKLRLAYAAEATCETG